MCNFILGTMFFGSSFPRGNYVGNKSSERQFSSATIFRGILSGGSYLWGNCPGTVIQGRGTIVRGAIFLGGNCPGDSFPRGQLSTGAIVRVAIIRGAIIQGAIIQGTIFLWGNFPDTIKGTSPLTFSV